jgi:hypothetical protein
MRGGDEKWLVCDTFPPLDEVHLPHNVVMCEKNLYL